VGKASIADPETDLLSGIVADRQEVSDDELRRLSELSDQISAKIKDLLILRSGQRKASQSFAAEVDYRSDPAFADWLKRTQEVRRRRTMILGTPDLFSEPAWDMILDLAYHQLHAKPVSVKMACIASNVPVSTALRYLGKMEEDGIVQRIKDKSDRRREFVVLTDDFMTKLYRLAISTR